MEGYMLLVGALNVSVSFLLLLGTSRLCGCTPRLERVGAAAVLGGVHAMLCLFSGFYFLGNMLWRVVCVGAMSVIAFGWRRSAVRCSAVFGILNLAMSVDPTRREGLWSVVLASMGVLILCFTDMHGTGGNGAYVPVELCYGDRSLRLTALRDTGNTLRDPVTGRPVLVVGAQAAKALLGLTTEQLQKPVESIGLIPGLRLIPYRSVGQPGGMLLALKIPAMKIGTWQGSGLVAFAPHSIGRAGEFEALAGGTV